jgi:hypothetical protein
MVVSILRPWSMAASEQPLPRWHDTRRSEFKSFPSRRAGRTSERKRYGAMIG